MRSPLTTAPLLQCRMADTNVHFFNGTFMIFATHDFSVNNTGVLMKDCACWMMVVAMMATMTMHLVSNNSRHSRYAQRLSAHQATLCRLVRRSRLPGATRRSRRSTPPVTITTNTRHQLILTKLDQ